MHFNVNGFRALFLIPEASVMVQHIQTHYQNGGFY